MSELSTFLRDARARIRPAAAGVSGAGRRRVPGLRRAEVAELAGISDDWYRRFESGRARLSLPAMSRLADALRLSDAERARLFALARPELARTGGDDVFGVREMVALRHFTRNVCAAAREMDVLEAATRAVNECLRPTLLAFAVRELDAAGNSRFEAVEGVRAEPFHCLVQSAEATAHDRDAVRANRLITWPDLSGCPSPDYRARVERYQARSYHAIGVGVPGRRWVAIGFADREPGVRSELQTAAFQTIAEGARGMLCRLAL